MLTDLATQHMVITETAQSKPTSYYYTRDVMKEFSLKKNDIPPHLRESTEHWTNHIQQNRNLVGCYNEVNKNLALAKLSSGVVQKIEAIKRKEELTFNKIV